MRVCIIIIFNTANFYSAQTGYEVVNYLVEQMYISDQITLLLSPTGKMERERPTVWTSSAPPQRTPWTCWNRAALRSPAGVRSTPARWDEPPRGHRPPLQLRKTVSRHFVLNLSLPIPSAQEVMMPSSVVSHDSAVFTSENSNREYLNFREPRSGTRCWLLFSAPWLLTDHEVSNNKL